MNNNRLDTILRSIKQNSNVLIVDFENIETFDINPLIESCNYICVATNNLLLRQTLKYKFRACEKVTFSSTFRVPMMNYDVLIVPQFYDEYVNTINLFPSLQMVISLKFINYAVNIPNFKMINDNVLLRSNDEIAVDNETTLEEDRQQSRNDGSKCSFYVVNYNTSALINLLIRSIHLYVKTFKYDIWVFDNSDSEKLNITEDCGDVHILDNTKGQLINYDEAIAKYCDIQFNEDLCGFISFKHAIAVQYGFDHPDISDNFILCDSDIVLKRDFTNFVDDSKALVGSVRYYQNKNVPPRLLPFLCYINRKFFRECNVPYFNPYKMHGCKDEHGITRKGYDTGASILEEAVKRRMPTRYVDINDYCVHFSGCSRTDTRVAKKFFDFRIIKDTMMKYNVFITACNYKNKKERIHKYISDNFSYKSDGKKYVIYTCITGKFDTLLKQPQYEHEKFDYVCFTNYPGSLHNSNWKIVNIANLGRVINEIDQRKIARFVKTHPHLFLDGYKKSIWIDANVEILTDDIEGSFMKFMGNGSYLLTSEHPQVNNVFDEIKKCRELNKDTEENLNKIQAFLTTENFNNVNEHVQTNVMLRDHNSKECQKLMEFWWEMIKNYSKRDQISFNYVFWKNDGKFLALPYQYVKTLFSREHRHLKND